MSLEEFNTFKFSTYLQSYFEKTGVEQISREPFFIRVLPQIKILLEQAIVKALQQYHLSALNYAQKHEGGHKEQAKAFFIDNEDSKSLNRTGYWVLHRDVYQGVVIPHMIDAIKQREKDILENTFSDKTFSEIKLDTPRQFFDAAFEKEFANIENDLRPADEKERESETAQKKLEQTTPQDIQKWVEESETRQLAQPGEGGSFQVPAGLEGKRWWQNGLYAFTWWRIKKEDAVKLRDGNHYPRNRGDLKPNYTETPNKHLDNLLAGIGGKEEGRVDGYYLGWMGLSRKGALQGRPHGANNVVPFDLKEDEVVMLGVARIRKFDLLRFKFNGASAWNMDWSLLHWKWDVWEDPQKSSRAEEERNAEKEVKKITKDIDDIRKEGSKEGDHPLKWMTKEYYLSLKKFVEDVKKIVDDEKDNKENPEILLPVLSEKGDAWKGLYLACSLLWAYNKKIKPDMKDEELKKTLDMLPTRLYINIANLEPYWRDTASKFSTEEMNTLLEKIKTEVEKAKPKKNKKDIDLSIPGSK